jgi:ADP-heptose:LPS heptosyltransferase
MALRAASQGDRLSNERMAAILDHAGKTNEDFEFDLPLYRRAAPEYESLAVHAPVLSAVVPPEEWGANELRVNFSHGVGDAVQFCYLLELYRRRGYKIVVECPAEREWLFQSLGFATGRGINGYGVGWLYPNQFSNPSETEFTANKTCWNINREPLPSINQSRRSLWLEVVEMQLSLADRVSEGAREHARAFLAGLLRPIILLHTAGTSWHAEKSIPDELLPEIYEKLGKIGSVVLLGNQDAPESVRRLTASRGLEFLAGLMLEADLLVGVDSGPFHLANLLPIPAVGVFFPRLPAHQCSVPNPRATYMVPKVNEDEWAKLPAWWKWQTHEGPTGDEIAVVAEQVLGESLAAKSATTEQVKQA